NTVGDILAVLADRQTRQGHRAVLGPLVGVEKNAGCALQRFEHVEDILVLETVVLREKVPTANLAWRRIALVVPKLPQAPADGRALGNGRQVSKRDRILSCDPLGNFLGFANVLLQPTVGVGDLAAVIIIDVIDAPRLRILNGLVADCRSGGGAES